MKKKKLLALIVTLSMSLSLAIPALAAEGETPAPWYAEAQQYVTEKGYMTGTDKGFEPEMTLTRAQVLQMLYNMAGKPEAEATLTDVAGQWYADAANWAVSEKLIEGAAFGEDAVITRAETAKLMADYAALKGLVADTAGMAMKEAPDYETIPAQYLEGMTFCFYGKVMTGDQNGNLNPMGELTRAEMAKILQNFGGLKRYIFDAEHPYDAVFTGLYNGVKITSGDDTGTATYYVPEGLQPYASVAIVLTPDNTTAAEFAETETGMAWRGVADADKIAVVFFGPDEGKTWNLTLDKDGRDDAAILNQLYVTVRSRSLSQQFPVGVNRGHIALAGYEEGGAAAILFGTRYATNYSGIAAVDAPAIPAESLKTVGEGSVLPFTGDGTTSGEELKIQAKTVDMPVWFINSDKDNKAAVDYFVAANEAKKAKANDYAETVYEAKDSDALIWISAKEQTPATIYEQFLGAVKRLRGIAPGRVSFTNDYTRDGFTIHEEEVNGELRRWITYVPTTYTGKEEVPMVLVMHGYGASMYGIAEESRWYDLAEENGFIAVFAQGLVRETANGNIPSPMWLAGGFSAMAPGADSMADINFLNTLLDKTEAEYKIDTSRVYATGHSNGSMMTWEMGVRATERFAAIAPIGYMTAPSVDFSSTALLPTWAMVGEYDNAATSDMVEGNGTVTALQAWNAHNGVDETKITDSKQQDGQFTTMTFANAEGVPLVRFTTVANCPHVYVQETSQTVWDEFFSKYSRGEDGKLFYEGKEVKADDYVASADWYTAAEK